MEKLQAIFIAFFTSLLSYFHPIYDDLQVLLIVFMANAVVGYMTDLIVNDKGFSFKKAWQCIVEFATFSVILACMYIIAEVKGIENAIMGCISVVSYGVLYFYSCNILRNLRQSFIKDTTPYKVIDLLYHLVSVEIIKSLPSINNYINIKKKENGKHQ